MRDVPLTLRRSLVPLPSPPAPLCHYTPSQLLVTDPWAQGGHTQPRMPLALTAAGGRLPPAQPRAAQPGVATALWGKPFPELGKGFWL